MFDSSEAGGRVVGRGRGALRGSRTRELHNIAHKHTHTHTAARTTLPPPPPAFHRVLEDHATTSGTMMMMEKADCTASPSVSWCPNTLLNTALALAHWEGEWVGRGEGRGGERGREVAGGEVEVSVAARLGFGLSEVQSG